MDLPDQSKAFEFIKKHGELKYLRFSIIFLLPFFLFFITLRIVDDRLSKFENIVSTKIDSSISSKINIIVGKNEESSRPSESVLGKTTAFNLEDWIIEKLYIDKEGYYCSNVSKQDFEYWSIWSKAKFPPKFDSMKIRFKLKSLSPDVSPASIIISYGEYLVNYAPQTFYRIVFFDGSSKSVRLYNDKNKSVEQDFIADEPDFNNEMTVGISPRIPDPNSRILNINPAITYTISKSANSAHFKSQKSFSAVLPTVELEDNSVQRQIGIGIKSGTCLKIISVEVKN